MRNDTTVTSRRGFLGGAVGLTTIVALGALDLGSARAATELPKVTSDDPTGKALGYVEQSAKEGQDCANCQLYTGKDGEEWGPCAIFPGKQVAAKGWCSSWVKKSS